MRVLLTVVVAIAGLGVAAGAMIAAATPTRQGDRIDASPAVVGVWTGLSYAYLVQGQGGVVLVDAGSDPQARAVRRRLAERGQQPSDVLAILITHGHRDHWAGAAQFGRAIVYVGAEDHRMVRGDQLPHAPLPRLYARLHDNPAPHANTQDVAPGSLLRLAGLEFAAIAMPGHTHGSMMYRQGGMLFAGDGVWLDGDAVMVPGWLFSRNVDLARRALRRLRDEPFMALCDGHAGCSADGKTRLERWFAGH